MASATPSSEQTTSTWLELLPQEAMSIVLGSLCNWYSNSPPVEEAYALSAVSNKLCEAVQKYLDNTAVFFCEEDFTQVQKIFPNGAKNVVVRTSQGTSPDDHPSLVHLLRSPELRIAEINANENLTSALLVKKSVIELELGVMGSNYGEHIISLLRALQLKRLKLNCYVKSPAKHCLSNSPLSKPDHEDSIPALCPDLEQLEISCTRNNKNAIFFRLLPHLQLTQARLRGHVREAALNQLRDMETVELSHVNQTVYHAERIGEAVTKIESFEIIDAQDLEILQGCTCLEALNISVESANINGLLELVSGLKALKKLEVRFNSRQQYSGKRGRGLESLPEGAVLKLFTTSQSLIDIGITGVKVPLEEMLQTTRLIGGRLRKFSSDLKGQEEGMFERMLALLNCFHKFCPRIEYTSFNECWNISSIKSQLKRKGKDYSTRRKQQKEIGKRLVVLIDGLKRRTRWREGSARVMDLVELLL